MTKRSFATAHLAMVLSQSASVAAFAGVIPLASIPRAPSRWSRESVRVAESSQVYTAEELLDAPKNCCWEKFPTPEMTNGISVGVARLCAAVCGQAYYSYEDKDFELNMEGIPKNELLLYDEHGMVRQTTTPFIVTLVPSEKTLVLGWQGSTTFNDFVHDLAFAPMASNRFRKFKNNVRVHVGFTAYAENDLAMYEDYILDLILEHDIEQLVFTGHSLGGGVATVTHFFILYMLRDSSSLWAQRLGEKANTLVTRVMTFSAPSSIAFFPNDELEVTCKQDEAALQETLDFLDELDRSCCVVANNQDFAPRLPGNIPYVEAMAEDYLAREVKARTPWFIQMLPFFDEEKWVEEQFDAFMKERTDEKSDGLYQFLQIASRFRHYGNVIFYESPTSEPLLLKDLKPPEGEDHSGATPKYFSQIKYNKMDLENSRFPEWMLKAHMGPVDGPGLAYQLPEKESKMEKPPPMPDTKDAANWIPKLLGK